MGPSIASSPCPTDGYILSEHRSVSKGMTCRRPPPPPALFVSLLITNQSTYQTDPQSSIRLSPYNPVNKDASLVLIILQPASLATQTTAAPIPHISPMEDYALSR